MYLLPADLSPLMHAIGLCACALAIMLSIGVVATVRRDVP